MEAGGREVKFREVEGGEWRVGWREGGLVVGVGEVRGIGEVEVGIEGVVLGWELKGVVVMLRAEAVAEDWALREAKTVGVEVGVEAGLA